MQRCRQKRPALPLRHGSARHFSQTRPPDPSLHAGLPEEVSHTKQCLARGYAVLALMSRNREYRNRCFSSSGDPALSE